MNVLIRAASLYVLTVIALVLGAVSLFEHARNTAARRELAEADAAATDLRNVLETTRGEKADLERLVRLSDQAAAEEIRKREAAELQLQKMAGKAEADPAVAVATSAAPQAQPDVAALRQQLAEARRSANAAEKEAEALRSRLAEVQANLPHADTTAVSAPPVTTGSTDAQAPAAPSSKAATHPVAAKAAGSGTTKPSAAKSAAKSATREAAVTAAAKPAAADVPSVKPSDAAVAPAPDAAPAAPPAVPKAKPQQGEGSALGGFYPF